METRERLQGRPTAFLVPCRRHHLWVLGLLLLLLGWGSVAPAGAMSGTIDYPVTVPLTVGAGETLNIVAGGSVTVGSGTAVLVDGGALNISGGSVLAGPGPSTGVTVRKNGTLNISGGLVTATLAVDFGSGTLNISGGSVNGGVALSGGTATISGGSVSATNGVSVNAIGVTLNIFGGSVSGTHYGVFVAFGTATISGGSVNGTTYGVVVEGGGTAIISGCTALTNAQPVSGGTRYTLTGTLLDGTAINTPAGVFPPGQIVLDERCGGECSGFRARGGLGSITVPSNPLWTDTGIALTPQNNLVVHGASGLWNFASSVPSFGPDGYPDPDLNGDMWITNGQHGQLIGFVGDNPCSHGQNDPAFFAIGTGTVSLAGKGGELWLGFNDDFATHATDDNTGSVTVQVDGGTIPPTTLTITPSSAPASCAVSVCWSGIPNPTATDWIGLYPQGETNNYNYLAYRWTDGLPSGCLAFRLGTDLPSGAYELRLFPENRYDEVLASAPLTVLPVPPATLTVSPSVVTPGAPLSVTWSGICAPTLQDWIGLFRQGEVDNHNYLDYSWLDGHSSGTMTYNLPGDLPLGAYELRLFTNNEYTPLTTSNSFTVAASLPAPSSLSLSPSTVCGGARSTGTVRLTAPAPPGGAVISLTGCDPTVVQVPPSVTVPEGRTSITFPVTTFDVPVDTVCVITACYGGQCLSAALTVRARVLSTVTVSPSSVTGPAPSTLRVCLSCPAPAGGALISLFSDNAAASVPGNVIVPAGQTCVSVPVTTVEVAANVAVHLTACYQGKCLTATLTVRAAILSTLRLSPTTVCGGASSIGTVTLTAPAPPGGAEVSLASSNPAVAQVPGSVKVAEGRTSATFPVTTVEVPIDTVVTITACYRSKCLTATLTVRAPSTLSSASLSPSIVCAGVPSTLRVCLTGCPAPAGGAVVSLASDNPAVAPVPASVIVSAGQTCVSVPVPTVEVAVDTAVHITTCYRGKCLTATLTVRARVLSSVSVSPSSVTGPAPSTLRICLSCPAPAGGALVSLSSDNAAASVPGSVIVPQGQTCVIVPVTTVEVAANVLVHLTGCYQGKCLTATLTVRAPAVLYSVSVSSSTVCGGAPSTGTVRLTAAAPPGGAVISLFSDNAAVLVPASVTVPEGRTSASFSVITLEVPADIVAHITACYLGKCLIATLTVRARVLSSVSVSPSSVIGPASSTLRVCLSCPAPAGGALVTLASANPAAVQVPASVTVPEGQTCVTVPVMTVEVAVNARVVITACFQGKCLTTTLTVLAPPALSSISFLPISVIGPASSTGTVRLTLPALAGGALVTLSSDHPEVVQMPASVTVPEGKTTASFPATTVEVVVNTRVIITGCYRGKCVSATLTVLAPPALSSLSFSPSSVVGPAPSTGTVRLTLPAPAGGAAITLSSGNPALVQVPSSVTVPQGQTTATFPATTVEVAANTPVPITACYQGKCLTTNLTVLAPPALSSLSFSPSSVIGPTSSTGSVRLTLPALAGGALVTLSSGNPAVAQVPASVMVPQSQYSATFTVTTVEVAVNTTVPITACYRGKCVTVSLRVLAPPALSSLSFSPSNVIGPAPSTGTVRLTLPALAGGAVVSLSSSNPAVAQVPPSVTVAQGQYSATFTVTTVDVATTVTVPITAAYKDRTVTRSLTVSP